MPKVLQASLLFVVTLTLSSFAQGESETRRLSRLNICELQMLSFDSNNPGPVVKEIRLAVGLMKDATRCERLAKRKLARLCKQSNRKGLFADEYLLNYTFKQTSISEVPVEAPCDNQDDPRCLQPFTTQYAYEVVAGDIVQGQCSEYVPKLITNEDASLTVEETDIESQ